jgi:hypothetical protein
VTEDVDLVGLHLPLLDKSPAFFGVTESEDRVYEYAEDVLLVLDVPRGLPAKPAPPAFGVPVPCGLTTPPRALPPICIGNVEG